MLPPLPPAPGCGSIANCHFLLSKSKAEIQPVLVISFYLSVISEFDWHYTIPRPTPNAEPLESVIGVTISYLNSVPTHHPSHPGKQQIFHLSIRHCFSKYPFAVKLNGVPAEYQ